MLALLIDRVGDWNPQLFRELKGRLQRRNLYMLFASSIASQFLIYQIYQDYTYKILNSFIPFILIVVGVYLVSKDIIEEEHQGTLNFIHLSPQSSENILLGKLLGVPILLYLGIGSILPLHFVNGLIYNNSFFVIVGNYILWGASCCLFYNLALAYSLLINSSRRNKYSASTIAGAVILLASFLTIPYLQLIQEAWEGNKNFNWFFIPIGEDSILSYFWVLMSIGVASKFIWLSINRRFLNPNTTLISKGQSYQLVTSLQLWVLGFFCSHNLISYGYEIGIAWLLGFTPFLFLLLIAVLSPSHQYLLDWARYRHQIVPQNNLSIWRDLIWGEKSPSIIAIGLNFLMTAVIWSVWLLLLPERVFDHAQLWRFQIFLALMLTLGMILIYSVISQIMLLLKTPKAGSLATGTISGLAILPLVTGGILGLSKINIAFLWIFSPVPLFFFINGSTFLAIVGIFLQLGILAGLTKVLQRQLQSLVIN